MGNLLGWRKQSQFLALLPSAPVRVAELKTFSKKVQGYGAVAIPNTSCLSHRHCPEDAREAVTYLPIHPIAGQVRLGLKTFLFNVSEVFGKEHRFLATTVHGKGEKQFKYLTSLNCLRICLF